MRPEILEQLTWHDLDEIIEANNDLTSEDKVKLYIFKDDAKD